MVFFDKIFSVRFMVCVKNNVVAYGIGDAYIYILCIPLTVLFNNVSDIRTSK